ncbi:DUF2064 domain-containing protein [Microbacterium sp. HD4P20]|uniref:TIGR04282 family arsenosugar biosynthesis glycosyltransferase n=1 Tax=Microbacterium sp. HD4P20 TaxID=2864874 RepID=UPI001C63EFBC|nr:DUF2064 domain-containing protein [Microbacterium sp. HD4P20]MCP2637629.1 DUF2064 domain-containing protein [Microbacterium sp. HD4P20]
MTTVVVMAKECVPGRVKTRLHPPYSLTDAAAIAAASLDDTLATVQGLTVERRVLCIEGAAPPAAGDAFEVVAQAPGGLDDRIAAALDGCRGFTVVIGMDTPQVTAADLAAVVGEWPGDVDAWFGPAADGGFWLLALREPRGDLVRGVPMSRADTGARQRARLVEAGLRVRDLATMTDLDDAASLEHVLRSMPAGSRLARTIGRLSTEEAIA